MDDLKYTFNGLGEYWMIQSLPFGLQARTIQGRDKDDLPIQATVYGGFAAKNMQETIVVVNGTATTSILSTSLHVELNEERAGQYTWLIVCLIKGEFVK